MYTTDNLNELEQVYLKSRQAKGDKKAHDQWIAAIDRGFPQLAKAFREQTGDIDAERSAAVEAAAAAASESQPVHA